MGATSPDDELTASEPEILADLRRLAAEVLGNPVSEADLDAPLSRLGMDSFLVADFAGRIAEELGRDVSLQEIASRPSLAALARQLVRPAAAGALRDVTLAVRLITAEDELRAVHRWLQDAGAAAYEYLDPLVDGSTDTPIAFSLLRARWAAGELVLFAVDAHEGGRAELAGVQFLHRRERLLYADAAGFHEQRRVLEPYAFVSVRYRGGWNGGELTRRLLCAPAELGDRGAAVLGAIAARPELWRVQAELLALTAFDDTRARHAARNALWQATDAAATYVERILGDPKRRAALWRGMRARDYGGVRGEELVGASTLGTGALAALLKRVVERERWPLVIRAVRGIEQGEARFLGFELRWLEPLFAVTI